MTYLRARWEALIARMVAARKSTSPPGASPNSNDFVGRRWRITVVQHGQSRFAIPARLGAWIEFNSNGQFGANDGVNGYGGTFERTCDGYRLGDDQVASTVGYPRRGDTPPSALAVIDAMRPMTVSGADVNANVKSGQLQLSTSGYQITAVPTTAWRVLRNS
jgi:hypothetical protein